MNPPALHPVRRPDCGVERDQAPEAGSEQRGSFEAERVQDLEQVGGGAVERIGQHLVSQIQGAPEPAFRVSPVDRVGAILNAVGTSLRDALLDGLVFAPGSVEVCDVWVGGRHVVQGGRHPDEAEVEEGLRRVRRRLDDAS